MKEFAYESKAMGSEVSISFVTTREQDALTAKDAALQTIAQYEQCFSRFRPDSELSILNAKKQHIVSPMFYELFTSAIQLCTQTHGSFNPLLAVATLGYTTTFSKLATDTPAITETKPYNTEIVDIQTNPNTREITLQQNQNLDFGGILKGFLSEKIARDIEKKYPDFQGIIINLGGDLHTRGYDEDGEVFIFSIYNPISKQEHEIPLHNQSLATSGTYKRTWKTSAGHHHHILDKSGTKSAKSSILSASVIGSNGATCEAYTKVLINTPLDIAKKLLTAEHLQFLTIDSTGAVKTNI